MLYFIRHGSTSWNENVDENGNKKPKCQGLANIPLNEKGKSQAEELSRALAGIKFDRVLCSPLSRAIETCKIVCKNDNFEIEPRLIERDFGEFEGMTRDQFEFLQFWNANDRKKYIKAESMEHLVSRVFSLLKELEKHPDKNYLLVSHGGVGCIVKSYFCGVPKDGNYISFEIPNGKPLVLDFKNKGENHECK